MQKIKHVVIESFQKAASKKYTKKSISPEKNKEHEESYANDRSWRESSGIIGTMCS